MRKKERLERIKNRSSLKTNRRNKKGGYFHMNKCFYCSNETEEKQTHYVTFHVSNQEKEEILCDECYQEWLLGIKG